MLCEYFKAGQCTKGFKCKFSHDLNIGRKTQKIDLFADKCAFPSCEPCLDNAIAPADSV